MKFSMINLFVATLLSILMLDSCASSQKLVSKGKYSDAVEKAVKKLNKEPNNKEELESLYASFDFANRDDLDKIKSLRVRGDGNSLIEVYRLYEKLDERSRSVASLSSRITDELNLYDFTEDLQASADDACEKVMEEALLMLEKNNREESRKALTHLEKVDRISPGYPGLKELIYDTEIAATVSVLFRIDDNSRIDIVDDLEDELKNEFKDRKWNKYYFNFTTDPVAYVCEVRLNRVSFDEKEKSKEEKINTVELTTVDKTIEAELSADFDIIDNVNGFTIERRDEEYRYAETHTRYEYEGSLDSLSTSLQKNINDTKNKPFPNTYEVAENNKEVWIEKIVNDIKKLIRDID